MYANSQRVLQNEKAGFKTFVWQTVGDNRVRSAHQELDGKVFTWETGADGSFPSQAIACRCSAEVDEDEVNESVKSVNDEYGVDMPAFLGKGEPKVEFSVVGDTKIASNIFNKLQNDNVHSELKTLLIENNAIKNVVKRTDKSAIARFDPFSKTFYYHDIKELRANPFSVAHEDTHALDFALSKVESKNGVFQSVSCRQSLNGEILTEKDVSVLEIAINKYERNLTKDEIALIQKDFTILANTNKDGFETLTYILQALTKCEIQNPNYEFATIEYFTKLKSTKGSYSRYPFINLEVVASIGSLKWTISPELVTEKLATINFVKEHFPDLYSAFLEVFKKGRK